MAAELEGVFAKYDTQESSSVSVDRPSNLLGQKGSVSNEEVLERDQSGKQFFQKGEVQSDGDNEFGDESGFEEFAAECAETSAPQKSHSKVEASVRSSQCGSIGRLS